MTENEKTSNEEKSSSDTNARPGYTYAAAFGQQMSGDQFVRVKLEINGQVVVVPVCMLCHKAYRLCSLDPNVTEEMIASAKYLGLADGTGQDTSDQSSDSSDKKDAKHLTEKKDTKESTDSKDSKDSKSTTDSKDDKNKDKDSAKTDEEKKKKKKWDDDQRRKTLPKTEWTTNKPSHDDWEKKKKKDF